MRKIGIITILNVNNYGAELQAFALNFKLRKLGYDNEIINYLYYKHPDYKKEKVSNPIVKISFITNLKGIVLKWIDIFNKLTHPKNAKIRKAKFDEFHKLNTNISKPYKSFSELYNAKLEYDTFIVGSDQVWNPNTRTSIKPYFLTFAPKERKRISFASSFGVGSLNTDFYPAYKECFEHLDYISCREKAGLEIIKDVTGKEATHVVDPTLLLSKREWESIMIPYNCDGPYILMYILTHSPYITKLALEVQKRTGYKIIRVCFNSINTEKNPDILNIVDAGPAEFLGLYANASFVITNSFHGSIFSLIFEKEFFTITPLSKSNNSRQVGLLKMVGLENRILKEGSDISKIDLDTIDYTLVNTIIEKEKEDSVEFLTHAINN
jgi:hypothetical protein